MIGGEIEPLAKEAHDLFSQARCRGGSRAPKIRLCLDWAGLGLMGFWVRGASLTVVQFIVDFLQVLMH
jgi:hypothetical protein